MIEFTSEDTDDSGSAYTFLNFKDAVFFEFASHELRRDVFLEGELRVLVDLATDVNDFI